MAVGASGTLGLAAKTPDGECIVWRVAPLGAGGGQEVVGAAECSGEAGLRIGEKAALQVAPVRGS